MPNLEIAFLGSPVIKLDRKPIQTDRRKAIALLAYLAVTNKSQTRDHLAGMLWPDYENESAFAYLRRTLWELNQSLGKGWIETERNQITFDLRSDVGLDTQTFHELTSKRPAKIDDLEAAVALYRDDFMAGFSITDTAPFEQWQLQETEYFRRELGSALSQLVMAKTMNGDYESALPQAKRWLSLDNINEFAHRAIISLHSLMGDRAGAIHQYVVCQQILKEELGISPQVETTELYEAVLSGDIKPTPSMSKISPSPELNKDVSHLPVFPTRFIGRRTEIEKAKALIQNSEYHLITILGPGGVGKTRLSIQVVSDFANIFVDGVFFIPLSTVRSAKSVPSMIAKALGLSYNRGEENPKQQLIEFLSQKNLLLILDNFEHLLEASDFVAEIITTAPNVKLVVTSQVRLNLQGEHLFPVSGMNLPDQIEYSTWKNPADPAKQIGAVQLFLERARQVQPDFDISEENAPTIIEICQILDGMPLGIELAAAWIGLLQPDEIIKEITRSLDFLETDQTNIPKRQRSIRAVYESSWKLLSEGERKAFLRLCVFVGSFSKDAAQEVSGASLRTLLGLMNKSWLQQTTDGRFQLHELMRQYGEESLRKLENNWCEAKNRHADYFAKFVTKQSERMRSSDQLDGLRALAIEVDGNIKVAWDWLVSEQRWNDLIEFMILGLFQYSTIRWKTAEMISWYREARIAIESSPNSYERLPFVIFSTLEIYEEESAEIKDANPIERLGIIWQMVKQFELAKDMGFWYLILTGLANARNLTNEESEIISAILNQLRENNKLWQLGFGLLILANWWGVYDMDEVKLVEAIKIFKEIGVIFEQGLSAELMGRHTYMQRYPYSEVIHHYEQARSFLQQLGGLTYHYFMLSHLADIYFQHGEGDKAFALFQEQQQEFERTGQIRLLEDSQNWEALFAARYSTFERALVLRQNSLKLAQKYGSKSDIAWRKYELGDVYRIFGEPTKAMELYNQARPQFEKMNMTMGLGFDQRSRGDIALENGRFADALEYYRRYLTFATEDNHLWGIAQARSRGLLANAYLGNIKQARMDLRNIILEIYDWRQEDLILQTLLVEPVSLLKEGKNEKALEVAAFIANHHVSWNETKQHARKIIKLAKQGLSEETIQSAIQRGREYKLDSLMNKLSNDQK